MASEGRMSPALSAALEGLYEDERLRSELTDDEASILLGWAQARLEETSSLLTSGADRPATDGLLQEYVQRLLNATREVNDLVGERGSLSNEALAERLRLLLSPGGSAPRTLSPAARDLVAQHGTLDNGEFIRRLTALIADSWRVAGGRGQDARRRGRNGGGRTGPGPLLVLGVVLAVALVVLAAFYFLRQPAVPTTGAPAPAATSTWYQVYFTTPRYPDNPADHKGGLDEKLTAFINAATRSVDMAIYQLDLDNVTRALLDAKGRGATVRVVTDVDILGDAKENPSFKKLQAAGIQVVAGNPNAIMHDKFVVVDEKAVWMGSWNFTTNDTYRYNNNGIAIQSQDLARNYTVTFEKMWKDKKFGAQRKPGGTTPKLNIEGTAVESYFAPEDGVSEKIVSRVKGAQKSIDFMAFSFTDDQIGAAVSARAKAGVKVRGVFEKTGSETQFSEYGRMKRAGLDVLQDGNPYLMHHKVFVIDGKTTVVGSFNFSQNAETANDENLVIVDEEAMAGLFTAEFERVQAQARNGPAPKDNVSSSDKESQVRDKENSGR